MAADAGSLLEQIRASPSGALRAAGYHSLARELAKQPPEGLQSLRLVLLSTFTTQFLDPFLKVEGARLGLAVDAFHGGFGQFEQVLLGDEWRADPAGTEALVIVMRPEDLDPDLPFRVGGRDGRGFDALRDDLLGRIESLLALFRRRSSGPVLVANFALPSHRPLSVFDANDPDSLTYALHDLNRELCRVLAGQAGAHVWDYHGLVAARGAGQFTDPRFWTLARTAVAPAQQGPLAAHLLRTLRAVLMPAAKCLVLDLDNTLWGGAIGDEGPGGIVLGDDGPGGAFKQFQRAVRGLKERGILLALCSKNDPEVVAEALASHPEMLLRSADFAAERINWLPKSDNLREIAAELDIGLDSLVFFDDNPVERAEVRSRAPEVTVVEVPTDPALYVQALADLVEFDMPGVTAEDQLRAQSYNAQRERRRGAAEAGSLDDFLASLAMTAEVGLQDELTAQRIAQLVAKTNQYNLTTRRHSAAELQALAQRPGGGIVWLRLADRYGDMGLVAVAIVALEGVDLRIDSLILSCRTANRGVEQALIAYLAARARSQGHAGLLGEYRPTPRNHVVAQLYPSLGFEPLRSEGEAAWYRLDLTRQDVVVPACIELRLHEALPT